LASALFTHSHSGAFCDSLVFSRLKKRIAKITGTFHLNMPHFLFVFIALAFMDGRWLREGTKVRSMLMVRPIVAKSNKCDIRMSISTSLKETLLEPEATVGIMLFEVHTERAGFETRPGGLDVKP
jgi:hypothetical protein